MTTTPKDIRIGPAWIHRLEQWDLDCWPMICVHWRSVDRSQRVFCLWRWGVQLGPSRWGVLLTTRALHIGRRIVWRAK